MCNCPVTIGSRRAHAGYTLCYADAFIFKVMLGFAGSEDIPIC